MLAPEDIGPLPGDVSALYFGGISLCNPPAADTYLSLAEREAGRCAVMLDPNVRPGFITDIPAYRSRIARMLAVADIVKVSDEDLCWLYPGPEALTDKLTALLKAGPSVVIMTRGGLASASDQALAEILGFGAQVAAVKVSRAGANPPWRDELPG